MAFLSCLSLVCSSILASGSKMFELVALYLLLRLRALLLAPASPAPNGPADLRVPSVVLEHRSCPLFANGLGLPPSLARHVEEGDIGLGQVGSVVGVKDEEVREGVRAGVARVEQSSVLRVVEDLVNKMCQGRKKH